MIREISKQQIDHKTAQGERVVLIEALTGSEAPYNSRHIPLAMPMHVNRVRELATQFLPDIGAEIVIYGEDDHSSATDAVAWLLSGMGYGNLYIYRGGKKEWFAASGFGESVHRTPEYGERVQFDEPASRASHFKDKGLRMVRELASGTVPEGWAAATMVRAAGRVISSRRLAPLFRGAVWGLAIYGGVQLLKSIAQQRRERMRGTDEASELPATAVHPIVNIDPSSDYEGSASSFHSASAAE